MTLSLIVNADDFGLTTGVNDSIVSCHVAGSVTSATMIANMDATEHAAALSHLYPTLSVGLHFNLTIGAALSQNDSGTTLTNNKGYFFNRSTLLLKLSLGLVKTSDIENELLAQMSQLKKLGIRPTHFDSHQHVHAHPQIFRVMSRISISEGVPLRMIHRWPGIVNKPIRRRISESIRDSMIKIGNYSKLENISTNIGLCSVFDLCLKPSELTESSYIKLIDSYQDGFVELMVHPANADDILADKSEIVAVSEIENKILRSSFLRDYVDSRGGVMASYRDCY